MDFVSLGRFRNARDFEGLCVSNQKCLKMHSLLKVWLCYALIAAVDKDWCICWIVGVRNL